MIYLASPYSHDCPAMRECRFILACYEAGRLMNLGMVVYSPIAHTHPIAIHCDLPLGWDYWERFDNEMIRRSNMLVILDIDGWEESKGVQAEVNIARGYGLPVFMASHLLPQERTSMMDVDVDKLAESLIIRTSDEDDPLARDIRRVARAVIERGQRVKELEDQRDAVTTAIFAEGWDTCCIAEDDYAGLPALVREITKESIDCGRQREQKLQAENARLRAFAHAVMERRMGYGRAVVEARALLAEKESGE